MSIETQIQTEVDALKARFDDTKSLYREVCALLFFRYGITPTTNKLYQFVRKGSMSAPSDALTKFWEELRSKARVDIERPDLPPELKATAAEAIAAIWQQATAVARQELSEIRIEVGADLEHAKAEVAEAKASVSKAVGRTLDLDRQLGLALEAKHALTAELESERRAHTGSVARLQELQRQVEDLQSQQERQRESFSADLAKAREAVEQANTRADANERRALLEVDQERQARVKAEKALDSLRSQAAAAEAQRRDEEQRRIETASRMQAALAAATASAVTASSAAEAKDAQIQSLQNQLAEASRQALQARTEADTVRTIVERLTPAAAAPEDTSGRRARRKSGSKEAT